jgi:DNA-binding NtrC family response regulator
MNQNTAEVPMLSSARNLPKEMAVVSPVPGPIQTPAQKKTDTMIFAQDEALRAELASALRNEGLTVVFATTREEVLVSGTEAGAQVLVVELDSDADEPFDLIAAARRLDDSTSVVGFTSSVERAVRAMRAGAENVVTKSADSLNALVAAVRHSLEQRSPTRSGFRTRPAGLPFLSACPAMLRIEEQVQRLRNADCSVLILGETGTGKSHLARRIHRVGARKSGPFVDVNCAGLSRDLVESELFGHERGAFTGAQAAKAGLFDAANDGTLFLDEVGDIDLAVQPKILKALEDKRFRRMGDVRERVVDVRLLAATNFDLQMAIERKSFRADLFYRISTVTITIPSLRDRQEDIVPLAKYVLAGLGSGDVDIAPDAQEVMLQHAWPGNIRELKNVLERSVLLRQGDAIRASDLRFDARTLSSSPPSAPPSDSMKEVEREHILRTLKGERGRVESAAKRLGIPRSTLYQKLRALQIDVAKLRRAAE